MTFIETCPACHGDVKLYENGDGTASGRCVCGQYVRTSVSCGKPRRVLAGYELVIYNTDLHSPRAIPVWEVWSSHVYKTRDEAEQAMSEFKTAHKDDANNQFWYAISPVDEYGIPIEEVRE